MYHFLGICEAIVPFLAKWEPVIERFIALMDSFMPAWRQVRDELNRLPVRHESWKY